LVCRSSISSQPADDTSVIAYSRHSHSRILVHRLSRRLRHLLASPHRRPSAVSCEPSAISGRPAARRKSPIASRGLLQKRPSPDCPQSPTAASRAVPDAPVSASSCDPSYTFFCPVLSLRHSTPRILDSLTPNLPLHSTPRIPDPLPPTSWFWLLPFGF
jgi:hypothetical protein